MFRKRAILGKKLTKFVLLFAFIFSMSACHRDNCPCHSLKAEKNIVQIVGKKFANLSINH